MTEQTDFDYEDWEDRIDAYLNAKMTDAERIEFESVMSNNVDLKAAVAFERTLKQRATDHFLFQHLKPQMEDFVKEKFPNLEVENGDRVNVPRPIGPLSIKGIFGVFSLVVVVILGVFLFNRYQKQAVYDKIITNWLTNAPLPYDNTNFANFQIGADSLAIQAYIQGDYAKADTYFSQNDGQQNNAFGARGLYRAINALLVQPPKTDKAIAILSNRMDNDNSFRHDAVEWYLALAYVQKHDIAAAKKVLEGMAQTSVFAPKADALLKELSESNF